MNTAKIALAATTAVALIILAACGGGDKKTLKAGIPETETAVAAAPDSAPDADGFITDARDGRKYRTVKIGEQTWMAENLDFETGESWCYEDDEDNCRKYGRLYDWFTALNACPAGWRLPDTADWEELERAAGGDFAGFTLKSKTGWVSRDDDGDSGGNGTDRTGFSALPGGYRWYDGEFDYIGRRGFWWSATEYDNNGAHYRFITMIVWNEVMLKDNGFSVRCLRDEREKAAAPLAAQTPDTRWYTANSGAEVFTISTADELAGLAELVNRGKSFEDKTIKLARDIVINDTANWRDWANNPPARQWIAIGTDVNRKWFQGTFDGGGHTVSGVYIKNRKDDQGLFGVIGHHGNVKRLNVTASYVKGADYVGILVGGSLGTITGCHTSGVVIGDNIVGGFIGVNDGMIKNGSASGSVKGKTNAGGFMGASRGSAAAGNHSSAAVSGDSVVGGFAGADWGGVISGNFSTGKVTGSADAGGFMGRAYGSLTRNNYYDRETSGQSDSGKGEGKTTADMQSAELVDSLNADAGISLMNVWVYSADKYPALSNKAAAPANISSHFASGKGTGDDPYIINTKEQLEKFSLLVNLGVRFSGKHLKLGQNIVLNDTTEWQKWETVPPAFVWTPAGMPVNPFDGTFDGDGHTISGVYVNNSNSTFIGLFGIANGDATIRNIGVTASYIRGLGGVGGLVGGNGDREFYNGGRIIGCYSTATVTGEKHSRNVGGLAGKNDGGTISGCRATGAVSGGEFTGGLVGINVWGGTISNSHATGAVSGSDFVGGLVGSNASNGDGGTVIRCYAIGAVSGDEYVGGLAGSSVGDSKIRDSYATGTVKGNDNAGGLVGGNDGRINNSYSIGKVKGSHRGNTGGLVGSGGWSARDCYFDSLTSGQEKSDGGTGKSTEQMKQKETFYGWNFSKTWGIDSRINNGYPYLLDESAISASKTIWENADWYTANPETKTFTISTAGELAAFAEIVNGAAEGITKDDFRGKTVRLAKNIDLFRYHDWKPVGGESGKAFRGTFDGGGHVICNLTIDSKWDDDRGLFGYIKGGTVKNLGLENVNIRANKYVGGIAGNVRDSGSLYNCYTTGKIAGHERVGGVAGYVSNGSGITNSYSTAEVSASDRDVGGLAGTVSEGFISNSYAAGDVSGRWMVGGLIGWVRGYEKSTVTGCYSLGAVVSTVKNSSGIGGLIGDVDDRNRVTGCAALGPEVKDGSHGGSSGRVAGNFTNYGRGYNHSNNAAWAQMKNTAGNTNWHDLDAAKKNGADISLADIMADPTIGGRFTAANGWTVKKGKLPGLRGKTVEIPEHLRKTP